MMRRLINILLLLLFAGLTQSYAQKERKYIRSGNDMYHEALDDSLQVDSAMMQKAEVEYRKAIEKKPSTYEGRNNLANSLYRQKKYEEALKEWESLTSLNVNERKKSKLYHNIGNAYLMNSKLKESIEAYKNALRNYPSDTATKYNLAFAQSKLREQQQQQKKNQQNKNQENKDQQKKNKQQQKQQQKDQQQKQQQSEQEKRKQQQQAQQKPGEQKKAQQKQGKKGEKGEKISKEDAMRILKALEIDEKKLQQELKRRTKKSSNSKKTEKDW